MSKSVQKRKAAQKAPDTAPKKTMICIILDRSGSMNGRQSDVIGGVNKFIDEQKAEKGDAKIALVRFDSEAIERFVPMTDIKKVAHLTAADYEPRASTPLLDAVGRTITELDADWKTVKPDRATLIIVTDGEENSSHEYKKAQVKAMIEARQKSGLWQVIYLGADVDAFHEAAGLGVHMANTAGYTKSAMGVQAAFAAASTSTSNLRTTGSTFASNMGKANLGEDVDDARKPAKASGVKITTTTTAVPLPPGNATVNPTWVPPATTSTSPVTPVTPTTWTPPI